MHRIGANVGRKCGGILLAASLLIAVCAPASNAAGHDCASNPQCTPGWSQADQIASELKLQWQPIGRAVERSGKLELPSVAEKPGVYRFELRYSPEYSAIYIGESRNLKRRFTQYRTPGPTQLTNIRLHDRMLSTLRASGEVAVSVLADASVVCSQTGCSPGDMGSDTERRLLERVAIHEAAKKQGVELLNLDLPKPLKPQP